MLISVYIIRSSGAGGSLAQAKKVDLDAVPQIKGQSIYEYDLETALEKPWRMPGMVCHSGWGKGEGTVRTIVWSVTVGELIALLYESSRVVLWSSY